MQYAYCYLQKMRKKYLPDGDPSKKTLNMNVAFDKM